MNEENEEEKKEEIKAGDHPKEPEEPLVEGFRYIQKDANAVRGRYNIFTMDEDEEKKGEPKSDAIPLE